MSLLDILFPEQAQAMHLREIARQGQFRQRVASRPQSAPSEHSARQLQRELEWANDDIGNLALVCESLIRLGERKGLFTRQELLDVMKEVDAEDGVTDGKFKPEKMTKPGTQRTP